MALAETYDFSSHIKLLSYILAIVGTFIVSYIFSKILAKKVDKIDMVTSLKGNEQKYGGIKMIKLILVRHGQSMWNLENKFTGWTDEV